MQHEGREEKYIEFWCGNLEGKRACGRFRRRFQNNIEKDLKEWNDRSQTDLT